MIGKPHQVTSIGTLTEFGVVVDEFDSTDTIEVSPFQLQRAETLTRRNETSRPRPDPAPLQQPRQQGYGHDPGVR